MLVKIAGFTVSFRSKETLILERTQKKYRGFAASGRPFFSFETIFKKRGQNPFRPDIILNGGYLTIERGDFLCRLNLRTGEGRLEISPDPLSFDSFLRVFYSWLLIRNDGLLIHAAGLAKNGEARLFPGRSGAGKSTLSRLALGEFSVLSDELVPLRIKTGKITVYGSPFWGEMQNKGLDSESKLVGIFFIKKSGTNRLENHTGHDFFPRMLKCVMNFSKTRADSEKILRTLRELRVSTPRYRLSFSNKNAAVLKLL